MITRYLLSFCAIGLWCMQVHAQPQTPHLPSISSEDEIPDDPTARILWDFERLSDPRTNELPDRIGARVLEFTATLPKRNPYAAKGSAEQSLFWRPAGPNNIGGRTRAFAIDIDDPDNMVAGAVAGGMWRSIDGGASWVKTSAPNDIQSVTCVAQDLRPGKRHIWYHGTGELMSTTGRRLDTIHRTIALGDGIFKSTDNGASWEQLESTRTTVEGTLSEHFQGIWRIVVDPLDLEQDIVYAACHGAVMCSSDGGTSWNPTIGDAERKAFNTEVQVTSTGVLYAALGSLFDMSESPKQGVWRSIDGLDWTEITPAGFPDQVRRTVIAVAPSNENILYVVTETPYQPEIYGFASSIHTLWRYTYLSGDGSGAGGRWEELTSVFPPLGPNAPPHYTQYLTLGGYCMTLAVHPENPDAVVIGGVDLFLTTDGFETIQRFVAVPEGNTVIPHPDNHSILFHTLPSGTEYLYTASDGGITRTDVIGTGQLPWELLNNDYRSSMFYSVAIDHATPGNEMMIGGLQDNGSAYTSEELPLNEWSFVSYGDGCASAISNNRQEIYVSAQFGMIWSIAYDAGLETYVQTTLTPPIPPSASAFNFITLFKLEPNDTRVMFMPARDRLWRHNDLLDLPGAGEADPNWQELWNVQTGGASITTLDVSTQPRGRVYFGTSDGRIFRIDNAEVGNPEAIDVSGAGFPARAFVSSVSVDPRDADKVLISLSNYGVQSLFYSENGGATWEAVGGNLEEHPDGSGAGPSVRVVKILPTDNGPIFFAGTGVGLYSTTSLAGSNTQWEQEGSLTIGSAIIEAIDARESDGRVVIGTQGNGVFTGDVLTSVDEPASNRTLLLEGNYPNPFSEKTRLRFHLGKTSTVTLSLHDVKGDVIATLLSEKRDAGIHVVEFDRRTHAIPAGTYFYRIETQDGSATRMMTVIN